MKAFQQNLHKLEAANTQVLGVSMDSSFANRAWAEQIGVTFPLLSDLGGEVTRQYGVFDSRYKAARRVTYLIGADGRIEKMQLDNAAIDPSETVTACERKKAKG
jgi:mycoredoxin-dependent peroxiredoxin